MAQSQVALGLSVPPHTPHAISVSLPTWRDNVGYEEGEKRVMDSMVSGYPRFFIHLSIRKVSSRFLKSQQLLTANPSNS
jgi:cystathionine gamma-synthase